MTRYIRRAATLCLVMLAALLVNVVRLQLLQAGELRENPANRRPLIARYADPRGDIVVGGRTVTGSKDTRQQLRYERTYHDGPLYAPVTGYSSQLYGTTLLEHTEDETLAGTDPLLAPLPLWNDLTRSRQPGGKIVTTIRASVQRAAYQGLAGRRGAVAALEPSTGRILALVSSPSYDPALLSGNSPAVVAAWRRLNTSPDRPMLNRAIRQTYPPGSAFKIVTAAAALDARIVTDPNAATDARDPYILPGTRTRLPNRAPRCDRASLSYALRYSCNTVMAHLGVRVGLHRMRETAEKFGFNDAGLRIPARVAASTFDREMGPDQLALSSIGQFDTAATPLQMAMVAAAVANGGELVRPYLVDRVTTRGGRTVSAALPRTYQRPMNPVTAQVLQRLMIQAVEKGGGRRAAVPGVRVGGKTGTAQHGVANAGVPYAWFIAWAQQREASRPAIALAVVVEDAEANREDISGGGDAAPIAKVVIEAALKGRGG
ncbi:penicillin-binding transpeptidase domain-containing protein [Streptomyces sp. SCSIO 30461]|uniref:penicillin-binding transpeptidase domain-containing protein n=1 Tax=Streptomyces sp. SCSIO 30461 TaxID=3118085 RepID=UPI0030CE2E83